MDTPLTFVLVHSPLVGAECWDPVAETLRAWGYPTHIATLSDDGDSDSDWWRAHVESAARSLAGITSPYALVGHSGAGALLPLIAQTLPTPPAWYLFVDAGILWQSASRLEQMAAEDSEWVCEFERYLRDGGTFPHWTEEQLRPLIPSDELRRVLLQSLRPKSLPYFTELIPAPARWENQSCAYLQLSDSYALYAQQTEARGWRVERFSESHHFTLMTQPERVAEAMLRLVNRSPL